MDKVDKVFLSVITALAVGLAVLVAFVVCARLKACALHFPDEVQPCVWSSIYKVERAIED